LSVASSVADHRCRRSRVDCCCRCPTQIALVMGYMSDEEVETVFDQAKNLEDVRAGIAAYELEWETRGLPPKPLVVELIGPVFLTESSGDDPPLLPEDRRIRAANPDLWQLVFMGGAGLDIQTFDNEASAETALAALCPDEFGEGGGVLLRGVGNVVKENLFLKYMQREDYVEFLVRATAAPPTPWSDTEKQAARTLAVGSAIKDRLGRLTEHAAEIARLKKEFDAKGLAEPKVIMGKPSPALVEFNEVFPGYISFGGCDMSGFDGNV